MARPVRIADQERGIGGFSVLLRVLHRLHHTLLSEGKRLAWTIVAQGHSQAATVFVEGTQPPAARDGIVLAFTAGRNITQQPSHPGTGHRAAECCLVLLAGQLGTGIRRQGAGGSVTGVPPILPECGMEGIRHDRIEIVVGGLLELRSGGTARQAAGALIHGDTFVVRFEGTLASGVPRLPHVLGLGFHALLQRLGLICSPDGDQHRGLGVHHVGALPSRSRAGWQLLDKSERLVECLQRLAGLAGISQDLCFGNKQLNQAGPRPQIDGLDYELALKCNGLVDLP